MKAICGNCRHWEHTSFGSSGNCTLRGKYTDFDSSCSSFDYGYYHQDREEAERNSSSSSDSGGCFITSMLCHVLGFDDHCDIMETLRGFRDIKMKQAGCYTELLNEYDTVGPKIADAIEQDSKKIELCEMLLKTYIDPIVQLIKADQDQEAVDKYCEMVRHLKAHYKI